MSIAGKIALVTGAGKGIGRALALQLAAEGVHVGLLARTRRDLEAVADEVKTSSQVRVALAIADISNRQEVETAVTSITEELGPIDFLINNAGAAKFGTVVEMDPDEWERMVRVNLFGTYYVTRKVLPEMMARKTGSIINVSSTSGLRGAATTSAYSASKFGVMGFTESLMQEARKFNIRVTAVTPSTVNTEMAASLGLPIGAEDRMTQADDVAQLIVSILKLPQRAFVNQAGIWTTNPQ
ncbi:3-ketoacyl-ACP reductase [Alicyclobacillus cycloheptanicus]|uniref:3-oxoacyl-[acyl-carrier protein] reductase n=1 Tax=Alicyclobacillus cycloheptanicus TaxID=1457 RepID=A0ABT9XHI2_9BACL|nr:3-ketoacyl-ACP reductase [Alicyclobacillus cycloheptanicus]MDQ0189647.1 3-oxoacyl-[acyl-carrier protein] reductase [Alicyclobacillus cycloheptanicus]WDL99950.1 3-ketoacyl-ACP reductase [Alicyclobacillus cycloheptanicus]